jgi:hypothetical protein
MRSKMSFAPAVLAAALAVSTPSLANTIYDVNVTAGTATIMGTITTDGHTGILTIGDLACATCSYDLTAAISGVVGNFEFTPANSAVTLTGSALTATATTPSTLTFDFTSGGQLEYRNPTTVGPPGTNGICFTAGVSSNLCPSGAILVKLGTNEVTTSETANSFLIGTAAPVATPIPAALPLFATGIGGLGLLGWRRKRKVQAV